MFPLTHSQKDQAFESRNPIFSPDALFCEEERFEEDVGGWSCFQTDDYAEISVLKKPLLTFFESDLFWEDDELLALLSKEKEIGCVDLDESLMLARNEAVDWILKVIRHYGFNALTAVLAVNYFDRFISGVCFQRDKPWMSQVAAVACVSIAAKVEEIQVPLLLDLQVAETKFLFEAKTIQRMELLVLSTLQWRMNLVTPISFIDHIIRRFKLMTNLHWEFLGLCERLILSVIADSRLLQYLPSVVATAIMFTVIKEIEPCNAMEYKNELVCLLQISKHESMGPTGGFSYFVFQQLYDNKQWSKLMRLGEEFQEELAIFLKQHQDLLWLHEVFLHQFSSATETLHVLALSQDDRSISDMDTFSYATNKRTSLSDRKRFLNLSKIAAMAGKDANVETKLKRIDADLKILNLQEIILELLPDDEMQNIGQWQLLPPMDLIELCLKSQSRELSLRAFDVFAWTSFSFLKSNTSLLEECWRNASNQDDWEKLYQASVAEGWSDEETLSILQDTILFQASSRCYGPNAITFEGSFNEVLPLRHESSELQNLKGTSVETILMQHKDFPDAGKLMLTAIMLGSVQGDSIMEEPSPME